MKYLSRGGLVVGVIFIFGLGLWVGATQHPGTAVLAWKEPATRVKLRPGPWGELEYIPMAISAPEESLPVRTMESAKTHWVLNNYTREQFAQFLGTLTLTERQRMALLAPAALRESPRGIDVTPPDDVFFELSEQDRLQIFQRLALYRENDSQLTYISSNSLAERFRSQGVSAETTERFLRLSVPSGGYRIFSGLGPMLGSIDAYEEKVHFVKALTWQKTLLLRLHLTATTDVNALTNYWGKACWNTDVKAMLTSVGSVPGGSWLDIIEVLPPLPTSLLYTFPLADNPLNGPVQRRDCHWTSFNFFRDPPDYHFSEDHYLRDKLRLDYFPISGDPRYGDLILFTRPDGVAVHSAIYLADEIVYTKNGDTPIHPWMLATTKELLEQYSFLVDPGQKLQLNYYRNKYY